MHDQSKHAGASLDRMVRQLARPEVAGVERRQRQNIRRDFGALDQEPVDAAIDNAQLARLELQIQPIGLRAANAFVAAHHRHHGPTRGHKFSISVTDAQGRIRGVVIAGRPVARRLDDGAHLEVLRVCTDGTPNVCSMLYGAVRRAAKAMGYLPEQIITYTLEGEGGTSLRAAGWQLDGATDGGGWDRPSRSRVDSHPTEKKLRWHAT
jgi:hypothetical protein